MAPVRRKRRGAPEVNGDVAANGHADGALSPEEDDVDVEVEMEDAGVDGDEYDEEDDNDAVPLPASAGRPPKSTSRARVAATQDDDGDDDDEGGVEDFDGSEDGSSMAGMDSATVAKHTADALASRLGFAQVVILEKVRVENFMCHGCLEFVFGPQHQHHQWAERVGRVRHRGGAADWAGRQGVQDGAGAQD